MLDTIDMVYDDEIVPAALYKIYSKHERCHTMSSTLMVVNTSMWGDVTGGWNGSSWDSPDGVVDQDDVDAVVDKWLGSPYISKIRTDLDTDVPNRLVNINDILRVVDTMNGINYPFDGPSGCP